MKQQRKIDDLGYVRILRPNHPRTDIQGYVRESILVFEDVYNCCVLRWAHIHHRDRNRSNDVWYNLQGMTRNQHMSLHHKGKLISEKSRLKNGCLAEGYQTVR